MLLLDRQSVAAVPLRGDPDRIQLQLRADGQLLELRPGKTTIGSGPRCNVRIQNPGVQPLHCLIVHEAERLSVRRWAGEARLNGMPFDESVLNAGDCLSVGPVEMDVIGPQSAKPSAAPPADPPESNPKVAGHIRVGYDRAPTRIPELPAPLEHERTVQGDLHQLVADLQEKVLHAVSERKGIVDRLESANAEVAAARQQSVERQSPSVERQQLTKQGQHLGREVQELTARINQLTLDLADEAKERRKLTEDHAVLSAENRRLYGKNSLLHAQTGELTNLNTALCGERNELRQQNEQLRTETNAIAAEKARNADERTALYAERDELRRENEQLRTDTNAIAAERASNADERAALYTERDELRGQNEQLRTETQSLAVETTAIAVERTSLLAERNELYGQIEQLRNENQALANEKTEITAERTTLYAEGDERRSQIEQLRTQAHALAAEKAAIADERADLDAERSELRGQVERLCIENQTLANEKTAIAAERTALLAERDELRLKIDQLRTETQALGAERGAIADERTSLYRKRNELQQQCEELQANIAQLNEETSALAVAKLAVLDERDTFCQQNEQLQTRIAQLTEEITTLAADKTLLSDEQMQLRNENMRLAELEREIQTAVTDRENTSAELYRALLQLAELQEHDDHNKALITAYESLNEEHQQLIHEATQLRDQITRLTEERSAFEGAQKSLVDEVTARNESRDRLADENAKLLAGLAEVRQMLEHAQQNQTALAGTISELQRELTAKQQAEVTAQHDQAALARTLAELERELVANQAAGAAAAAAIAEGEQKHAEQARQFAESISRLEHQLAAADDARKSLERARDEYRRQIEEAERHRADQSRRIAELESQSAAAENELAMLASRAANPPATVGDEATPAVMAHPAAEVQQALSGVESFGEPAGPLTGDRPLEINWSSPRAESSGDWSSPSPDPGCPTVDGAIQTGDASVDPWNSPPVSSAGWRDSEQTAGSADAAISSQDESGTDASPIADFSIWKQGAGSQRPTFDEPATNVSVAAIEHTPSWGDQSLLEASSKRESTEPSGETAAAAPVLSWGLAADAKETAEAAPQKTPSTSYIERYSHMFVDDVAQEASPAATPQLRLDSNATTSTSRSMGVGRNEGREPASAASDAEESIEQYMAKLLQRVRGESPHIAASQASPASGDAREIVAPASSSPRKPAASIPTESSQPAADEPETEEEAAKAMVNWEAIARRAAAATPNTNLDALRALANETARRAIGRHELKKHRRDAVTKVIVSTLAGVTSLWLMLDAPNWLDIQFITACVSLIVAAYWAGETFRALLETLRAAAYDGPEAYLDESDDEGGPKLPIDIENPL